MNKRIEILLKGIYAGVFISIGGIVYLSLENKIFGSFLFSIGLLCVCMYNMNLYTGKVGYLLNNKLSYFKELLLSLLGNFIGAFAIGNIMNLTRLNNIVLKSIELSNNKLNDTFYSIFILSFFCGIMMYVAVNNFKKSKDVFGKYIGIFMCVMVFILSGFEHCVANMFYFSLANVWSLKTILYLIIMILGNSIGSFFISYYSNKF